MSALNKKIEIWLPNQHEIILSSPYLLTPISRVVDPLAMTMLTLFVENSLDDNPYWETLVGSIYSTHQRFVITHFWRTYFDSKFVGTRIPRQPKELREMVKAEAELWESVLRLLERMQACCFLWRHPGVLLGQIICEATLVMVNFKYTEEGKEIGGATTSMKQLQSQNRILEGLENPFTLNKSPTTYRIIEKAIELADSNDNFRRDFYMKIVRSRMTLVRSLIHQKIRLYDQKKMVRQGRKRR